MQHPFLMHMALTMTLVHDRVGTPEVKQTARELYHWNKSISLFNRKLSGPLTPSERDALWITSALLGCASLAHVDETSPEEVWPLCPPSPADLDWLKLSEGKKAVWELADSSRPESALRKVISRHDNSFMIDISDEEAFGALPADMLRLCNLGPDSIPETNIFYFPAAVLGRLMPLRHVDETRYKFMAFMVGMSPAFLKATEDKDPRALLLMAYFLAKLRGPSPWWAGRRLRLEAEAVCRYLERFYGHIPGMRELMEFPQQYAALMDFEYFGSQTAEEPVTLSDAPDLEGLLRSTTRIVTE